MSQENRSNSLIRWLRQLLSDDGFVDAVERVQVIVAKILSIAMLVVIFEAVWDLSTTIFSSLVLSDLTYFKKTLFEIFGLFLNVLIALEILENITAYLRKHVFQVELVIATSLIAVARKIIILDLEKTSGLDIIGLASAVFALSISYWLMRTVSRN
ncbi:phosphate-starvation-inducible PsiE family protein [Baaleninema simplex]|uniref:phosphate-starvation-inducible PsiE family protein n=1 Tax=Baaleninema simplex TaxID=2862350 RepID=UPI00037C5E64|nr:phosphate-starvation-inducible PsiE family protein [Baaleninema simplex]